jgi:hypothetical protein
MHPDLVNLQAIDGDIVDMKYLVIVRNTTVSNWPAPLWLILCRTLSCQLSGETLWHPLSKGFISQSIR